MLYIILVYLMLFATLFNTVCLYNTYIVLPLSFANAFCFIALSWFIDTLFVNSNIILRHAQCL